MKRIVENLRGCTVLLCMVVVTLIGCIPLIPVALVKLLAPWPVIKRPATTGVLAVARYWARLINISILKISGTKLHFEQQLPDNPNGRYVLISNHQCWADVMLQVHVLEPQLPFPRFFIKEGLRWLPVIGLACWALDYPFMKRHSREQLEKNPALRNEDMNTVRRACEVFRELPVSIVNYAEGTRSTAAKRAAADSPYKALLPPKAGGTAFALNAMRDVLDGVLDMTVAYVNVAEPKFWDVLCGRVPEVAIRIRQVPISADLLDGDYSGDPAYRARLKQWLENIWADKDIEVAAIQNPDHPATRFWLTQDESTKKRSA